MIFRFWVLRYFIGSVTVIVFKVISKTFGATTIKTGFLNYLGFVVQ